MTSMNDIHSYEIEQCQKHPGMSSYSTFAEIPNDQISESSLVAWIVSGGKLAQILTGLRTERVLWAAARHDDDAYRQIGRDQVSDHRALSVEAIRQGKAYFFWLPEEYKDEQMLIDMTIFGTHSIQNIDLAGAYKHLLTERVAEAICSRSLSQAHEFGIAGGAAAKALIRDKYLEAGIRAQTSDYGYLEMVNKQYLLVKMLAFGFWPDEKNFNVPDEVVRSFVVPPSDPIEALERIGVCQSRGHKLLHRSWLQTRPTKEVVDALQGSAQGLDELFRIYPEQEMRKHMKTHRSIRGRLLEQDLGM